MIQTKQRMHQDNAPGSTELHLKRVARTARAVSKNERTDLPENA